MTETPPSHPLFDQAPGRSTGVNTDPVDWYGLPRSDRERALLDSLKPRLEKSTRDTRVVFRPELLVRTYVGDHGDRPYSSPFWESPDIWFASGHPSKTPAVPAHPGGSPMPGDVTTMYAHVWNLGLAPVIGVSVEFLVFDPSILFSQQKPLFRAVTRVDLGGRSSPGQCHALVKCPQPWTPVVVNNGHECAIVRVSCVGDALQQAHEYEPAYDRHVAQRNLQFTTYSLDLLQLLLRQLTGTLPQRGRLVLEVVGREAQHAVDLVAPGRRIDPEVQTRRIGSIDMAPRPRRGEVTVVRLRGVTRDQAGAEQTVGGYTLVLA
jgi:hypothetical protein